MCTTSCAAIVMESGLNEKSWEHSFMSNLLEQSVFSSKKTKPQMLRLEDEDC